MACGGFDYDWRVGETIEKLLRPTASGSGGANDATDGISACRDRGFDIVVDLAKAADDGVACDGAAVGGGDGALDYVRARGDGDATNGIATIRQRERRW